MTLELPVPRRALEDSASRELMRVWIADGASQVIVDHREFGRGRQAVPEWATILGHAVATVAEGLCSDAAADERSEIVSELVDRMISEFRASLEDMTSVVREVPVRAAQ
jgi:hypothetical protein